MLVTYESGFDVWRAEWRGHVGYGCSHEAARAACVWAALCRRLA